MGHYIAKYVKACDLYNQTKMFLMALVGKLMPNHILVLGKFCEGDTETRPLIYRDSLRQGEPNRCDTLTLTQW